MQFSKARFAGISGWLAWPGNNPLAQGLQMTSYMYLQNGQPADEGFCSILTASVSLHILTENPKCKATQPFSATVLRTTSKLNLTQVCSGRG